MASKTKYEAVGRQDISMVRLELDSFDLVEKWFFQVSALIAAITFGIFSILSWTIAQNAKAQANTANLVALAALCGNVPNQDHVYNSEVRGFCEQLFPYAWSPLAEAVAKSFPDVGEIKPPKASGSTYVTESTIESTTLSSASPTSTSTSSIPVNATTRTHHATMSNGTVIHTITSATMPATKTFTVTATLPEESGEYNEYGSGSDHHDEEYESDGGSSPGLDTTAKIGIGVGLAIGIPVVLVSVLTYIRWEKLQRDKLR